MQMPAGHVPVCIAPLYVIAQVLQASAPAVGTAAVDLPSLGVRGRGLFTVPHRGRGWSYDLAFESVEATDVGVELRLQAQKTPRPKPRLPPVRQMPPPRIPGGASRGKGQEPEASAEEDVPAPSGPLHTPARLAVTLVPPYRDCLHPDRVGASALALGFAGLAHPLPEAGVRVSLPAIADRFGKAAREVLCDGAARTILIEERTGEIIDIPPDFWRTDEAETALAADEMVTVPIPKTGDTRGLACIDRNGLSLIWHIVRSRMPGPEYPAKGPMVKPALSPAMEFMQEIAAELQYSGGMPFGKYSLSKGDIAAKITQRWNDQRCGPYSNGLAHAMGILILHPRDRKGGAPDVEEKQLRLTYRETVAPKKRKTPSRLRAPKRPNSGRK